MTEFEGLMRQAFEVAGAYSEDDVEGLIGLARMGIFRESLRSLCDKHGGSTIDEHVVEDWLRADVERIAGLTPGRREELIVIGVQMVTKMGDV